MILGTTHNSGSYYNTLEASVNLLIHFKNQLREFDLDLFVLSLQCKCLSWSHKVNASKSSILGAVGIYVCICLSGVILICNFRGSQV